MVVLPSGSMGVMPVDWRSVAWPEVGMPSGTLLRALPLSGPTWTGKLCIFIGWQDVKGNGHPWCEIVDNNGNKALLPRQAFEIISYPI
jgi:hypothetical protein